MGSGVAEMLDVVTNSAFPCIDELSPEELVERTRVIDLAHEKFTNREVVTIFGPQRVEDYPHYSNLFEAVSQWVDVSCWHMDVGASESMAMWKIYGSGSASVCIESTVGNVIDAMIIPDGMQLVSDRVTYLDFASDSVGSAHPLSVFFHKSRFYEFENELRFLVYPLTISDPRLERSEAGTKIAINPDVLIKRILISPTSPAWFKDLVGLILKGVGVKVEVVKSKIPLR
jgi:hypothetical protein